jgi:hypothetical protein
MPEPAGTVPTRPGFDSDAARIYGARLLNRAVDPTALGERFSPNCNWFSCNHLSHKV